MIYLLPGMGANQRMYSGPWRELPECTFIDWPSNSKEGSLAEVAKRIVEEQSIADGAVLVGTSLGGMVSCEIAKIRKVEHLILVGSATKKEEISGFLQSVHPLIDQAPLEFLQRASRKLPGELFGKMSMNDAQFIRNMCRAVFRWEGHKPGTAPVHRIHGRLDVVISHPTHVDRWVNGGHLIAITHAADCVQFVEAICSRSSKSSS